MIRSKGGEGSEMENRSIDFHSRENVRAIVSPEVFGKTSAASFLARNNRSLDNLAGKLF